MNSPLEIYVAEVAQKYATGRAGEHAYRPAFERLIASIDPKLKIVNDPKRTEHGAPDFVFVRGDLTAGYAETKDIGIDLNKTEKSEQMERYLGYSNLILTDYLEFRFFRNGEKYEDSIAIAAVEDGHIVARPEQFAALADLLSDFFSQAPESIKSGTRLAKIMGGKARRIRDNVRQFLANPSEKNRELERIFETIKKLLVHDLSPEEFADLYAQTLVYGLFAARFHDTTPEDFSRQEARDLVPASNPFLRHFFDHIVGPDFDVRLQYIVNELCEIFVHADVHALMGQYFKKNGEVEGPDPVIHFYEDFLREYDPEQRKKMGAFYTPLPVVRFIVRAVDAILQNDFGLPKGLADTSKVQVERTRQGKRGKVEVHRVQILDPAVGTGTFLNEIIRSIAKRFEGQGGRWSGYVDEDLLPRLYGFELMMASYTIAHLKLGMTLEESGYKNFGRQLGVYLTNSLEEGELPDDTLFGFGFSQSILAVSSLTTENRLAADTDKKVYSWKELTLHGVCRPPKLLLKNATPRWCF
ncbi:MAG: N-6 DNA methylase [Minisyncoccia bacterium]